MSRAEEWGVLVASAFAGFLLYSAGVEYLLLACMVYAPGTLLYLMARREQGLLALTRAEAHACALLSLSAVVGVVMISMGALEI